MSESIFLSASIPDPKRAPQYAATSDIVAISAAVSSLLHVTLGRRVLVWGGHPAITPMVWVVAQDIGVNYGDWVRLYQSNHFKDEFPEDNKQFQNVTFTEDIEKDREKSLLVMRERMFKDRDFMAGVFVGGMGGIVQEYELFRRLQPNAKIVPVISTGGAVLDIAKLIGHVSPDLASDLDYVSLFHRHLDISVREERFVKPNDQPADVKNRLWTPKP